MIIINRYMKKKSPHVKISKHKSVLIGAVLILAGFSILFFSIGLNAKRVKREAVLPDSEVKPLPSQPLAMAPPPADKPLPQPPPAPESPQKPDNKPENSVPSAVPPVKPVPDKSVAATVPPQVSPPPACSPR